MIKFTNQNGMKTSVDEEYICAVVDRGMMGETPVVGLRIINGDVLVVNGVFAEISKLVAERKLLLRTGPQYKHVYQ